jgi:hypothetical protein
LKTSGGERVLQEKLVLIASKRFPFITEGSHICVRQDEVKKICKVDSEITPEQGES